MGKSKKNDFNKQTRLLIAVLLLCLLAACIYAAMPEDTAPAAASSTPLQASPAPEETPAATPPGPLAQSGYLDAYVLDVGQGDSIFLRSPSGKTMLVDASTSGMYTRIHAFLEAQNVKRLDIVIATHPHADHIGGMERIVRQYEIGAFYMPDAVSTSKTFEKLIDALEELSVPVYEALGGEAALLEWDEQVEVRLLSPLANGAYENTNDFSVVCRVRFGETAILLTGDAQSDAEEAILRTLPASYLQADILKVGHHGSSTSTGAAFFAAVDPAIAIMSLGKDNTYGHPHEEIVSLLEDAGIPYYQTDMHGTVHVRLDGAVFHVETEK